MRWKSMSGCALAHAGLADANVLVAIWGLRPPDVAFGAARRAAARALELDPNLAEAHTAMGEVLKGYEWDWCQAERHYQRALVLRPDYATAHQWYAQLLISLRRYPEAASHIELARRADPVSPVINAFLPLHLSWPVERLRPSSARSAPSREPGTATRRWRIGISDAPICAHISRSAPSRRWSTPSRWGGRDPCGSHTELRASTRWRSCWCIDEFCNELSDRARHEYVSPYDLAVAFTGIGDHACALDHLEQAFSERVMRIVMLGDPEFDGLRGEPRYGRLLDGLRLTKSSDVRTLPTSGSCELHLYSARGAPDNSVCDDA